MGSTHSMLTLLLAGPRLKFSLSAGLDCVYHPDGGFRVGHWHDTGPATRTRLVVY